MADYYIAYIIDSLTRINQNAHSNNPYNASDKNACYKIKYVWHYFPPIFATIASLTLVRQEFQPFRNIPLILAFVLIPSRQDEVCFVCLTPKTVRIVRTVRAVRIDNIVLLVSYTNPQEDGLLTLSVTTSTATRT